MIHFERLLPERKAELDQYLMSCGQRGCEYSFVNLYLWGRQTVAVMGGYLALFSHFNGHSVYPFPVGQGDIPIKKLLSMAEEAGYEGFCSAEHYGVDDQWDFIVKSAAWLNENM